MTAHQPRTDRMERPDPHSRGLLPKQVTYPLPHLAGGLVGERDGQDGCWVDAVFFDEVRNAVGQHARFAGARARKRENGPFEMLYRGTLFGIQSLEKLLRHLNYTIHSHHTPNMRTRFRFRLPAAGSSISKTAPPAERLRTATRPPCRFSTIRCVSDSPTPQPDVFVLTPASKIRSRTD